MKSPFATLAGIVFFAGLVGVIYLIRTEIVVNYRFERDYLQLWQLADKSSTIPAKQKYIAEFVAKLKVGNEHGEFATHDAVWLRTPNNSFEGNLAAVETLSSRLTEIQQMNPSSFEYNTAIQQITAQEQGEAHYMLSVLKGCYVLQNYPAGWRWIAAVVGIGTVLLIIVSARIWLNCRDN